VLRERISHNSEMSVRLPADVDRLGVRTHHHVLEIRCGLDVVFAVRVGVFHREPERARALVEPWLRPNGSGPTLFDLPTR
jgi:hypothetical protein